MATHIYLDESGDLGWQLEKPHNRGGSSPYLVIAALIVPPQKDHLPERRMRQLYKSRHRQTTNEKKWVRMSPAARSAFATTAAGMARDHSDITFRAIVAQKRNVMDHIRTDPNKLCNYMTKLLLIEEMARHDTVHFVPDPRSIQVESGRSLHDYLQAVTGARPCPIFPRKSSWRCPRNIPQAPLMASLFPYSYRRRPRATTQEPALSSRAGIGHERLFITLIAFVLRRCVLVGMFRACADQPPARLVPVRPM